MLAMIFGRRVQINLHSGSNLLSGLGVGAGGDGGGKSEMFAWRVFLNKQVADRSYEVRLNAPTLLAVVLSSSSDASSLLPCLDTQIVKEVGGVRGARQEATESIKSLDAGVFIINMVKVVE